MGRPDQRLRQEVRMLLKSGRIYRGWLVHVRVGPSEISRTLISVRRQFGPAVERNRVRRRIRAICRTTSLLQPSGRLVLITVSDRAGSASFADLHGDLHQAFSRLHIP